MAGALDEAYRRARVLLGNRVGAEDAGHDAAERAWRSWGSLRDEAQFDAWFSRILVNLCRDRLRRRRRVAFIEIAATPGETIDAAGVPELDQVAERARL